MLQQLQDVFQGFGVGQGAATTFSDVDGSAITEGNRNDGNVQMYEVTPPRGTGIDPQKVAVLLFDRPTDAAALQRALDDLVNGLDVAIIDGIHVCGFDTETGTTGHIELMQLSMGSTCLLLRRGSGLFGDDGLRRFFLNELYPKIKIVFSGAELATADALDMLQINVPIRGLLDLTPIFWGTGGKIQFANADGFPKGLKKIFNDVFRAEWYKDKAITMSNWGQQPTLTLPQVKYAALDAWTSEKLGVHVFRNRKNDGIYKMVFSTADYDALMVQAEEGELLVKQVVRQSKGFDNMQKREPKAADVSNMRVTYKDNSGGKKIDIVCSAFGNRVHVNIEKVEFRVISPGGSPRGVSVWATVVESKVRLCSACLCLPSTCPHANPPPSLPPSHQPSFHRIHPTARHEGQNEHCRVGAAHGRHAAAIQSR